MSAIAPTHEMLVVTAIRLSTRNVIGTRKPEVRHFDKIEADADLGLELGAKTLQTSSTYPTYSKIS